MKFTPFLLVFVLLQLGAFAQTKLYEHPQFDQLTKNHQTLGIMPFRATIKLRPKDMKELSQEQLADMAKAEGKSVQSALYSWFLKRSSRMRVTVQDVNQTNAKLKKAGITEDNIDEYTPKELADIIGTDAVIMGSLETNKPMSEGASVALGLLVGFYGSTNKAVMNLFIYDRPDGQMLINYHKGVSGSIGSSTEDLINVLMRKASRRISYTK